MFGPVSGAHFNPAVSLVMSLSGKLTWREFFAYAPAQFAGCIAGVGIAHAMFAEELYQYSTKARDGMSLAFSEFVATFGLLGAILAISASRPSAVPAAVGLYITSAYWFTASTSFANPAVTVARAFTDTFAGIAPHSVPVFVAAQVLGALSAMLVFNWLLSRGSGK
jgi:glycerol uptake facilitator-like aquaporin